MQVHDADPTDRASVPYTHGLHTAVLEVEFLKKFLAHGVHLSGSVLRPRNSYPDWH